MLDINNIRSQFPILTTQVYGRPLVYLDNAATTQKPRCVVEAAREQYYTANANVHRGVHYLSQQATDLLEQARQRVSRFINAPSEQEIIFTRGTTEAVNLVAASYGELLHEGDEVIISEMEHHSNIVPWQLLQERRGVRLRVIPFSDDGELDLQAYASLFSDRTRMVSITHVSNVLGTVNPVREMISLAHSHGVPVMVDAAQSVPHFGVDVQELDCDFLAFSGHKVYGPTGIGVLYGRRSLLEQMPPYQGGGEMISTVSFDKTTFEGIPYKFEAGTPNYVAAHALANTWPAHLRPVGAEGCRGLLPGGRHPPSRHGHPARPPRHSRAHWPPLRPARHDSLWGGGYGESLLLLLQYRGRGGCPGRRHTASEQDAAKVK